MIIAAALTAAAQQAVVEPQNRRCRWEEKVNDAIVVHLGPERDCAAWQAPRAHVGLWRYQFEGSGFVAEARTLTEAEQAIKHGARASWLSFDEKSEFPANCRPVLAHAYRVSFIGRDAVPKSNPGPFGGFGHMGMWPSEVLLDRITSIEDLGELPGTQVRALGAVSHCPIAHER